jgi:hypothetical protein
MSRLVEWRESHSDDPFDGSDVQVIDYIGNLGPIRAFTLSQLTQVRKWELTSHFIPSKMRGKVFDDVEVAKRACQKIVDDFSKWLAG